ncbi:peroxisomal targeting signal 1 receptor [Neocloeon triangulifer]|uniref:peroxisomal targeting signal 1 receptor n=1 Tax=Neocloeon triangulifer TaxID=2078957 RepID=UPI00286F1DA1|nr:peroxisomal targeting signal 1 receptor [Neocloeon triangulifer]
MALRELVEGECGGANSLVRLTSHFVQDRAHKEDGLRHHFPPHPEALFGESSADQFVQEFLEETLVQRGIDVVPQTFHMDSLLQEMREIESARHSSLPPIPAPGVAQALADGETTGWADQFAETRGERFNDMKIEEIWNEAGSSIKPLQSEKNELGFGPSWTLEYLQSDDAELSTELENAWQEGSVDTLEIRAQANELVTVVDNQQLSNSKFMQFMRDIGEGEIDIVDGKLVTDVKGDEVEAAHSWVKEFAEGQRQADLAQGIVKEDELWANLQKEWEKSAQENGDLNSWFDEFSSYYDPFKQYSFEKENPMLDSENPLEEGKRKLAEGDLPSAVLLFEAAVQKDENSAEAWQLLGTTQAENEQDPLAIPALKKCLQLDPQNLTALMALAVCYTNESYQNQACQALRDWLKGNPKYSDLVPPQPEEEAQKYEYITSLMTNDFHKEVHDLFLAAANRSPISDIDSDVQCGLGVLFNLSNEYDKAVDCFRAALDARPDDSRMWNRLGATLANGNRSEEAVDAYQRALELAPGFIRARYNVGITCVNLNAHREAAEHFISALNIQASGKGIQGKSSWRSMSESIWSSLRLVVSLLNRQDLFPVVDSRDLAKLNEEFKMEEELKQI